MKRENGTVEVVPRFLRFKNGRSMEFLSLFMRILSVLLNRLICVNPIQEGVIRRVAKTYTIGFQL